MERPEGASLALSCTGCGRRYRVSAGRPIPGCPKCGGVLARTGAAPASSPRAAPEVGAAGRGRPRPAAPARKPGQDRAGHGRRPLAARQPAGRRMGKKTLAAIVTAVVLVLGLSGLALLSGGKDEEARRARTTEERSTAGRGVLDALALKWRLEAEGVREGESAWSAWRSAGPEEKKAGASVEDALRAWLREKRPAALRKEAESFLALLDESCRSTIEAASSQLGVPGSDFVLDWLTFRGYSHVQSLEKLWKEPRGFPALKKGVVDSTFEGVAVPPSRSSAFAVVTRTETSLKASIFGCKLHASRTADAAGGPELPVRSVTLESNDHRLRDPLVELPDSLEVLVTRSATGAYLVNWKAEIEEYLRTGNREEWRSEAIGLPSVAAERPAPDAGSGRAPPKQESDAVLLEKLWPAVPMIETGGGWGSGFVVDAGGRAAVITNLHVLLGAREELTVRFFKPGSTEVLMSAAIKTDTCRAHEKADLVLVPLEKWKPLAELRAAGIQPIPLVEKGRSLRVGEPVLKIGHPGGGEGPWIGSAGRGMVSGPPRPLGDESILYVQMTVNINPGDSGGPLLDLEGHVIGVNTMRQVISGGVPSSDINFALDVSYVRDLIGGAGAPLPGKQREVLEERPIEARRVETELLLWEQGYNLPDGKNTLSLALPPNGEAERKIDLRPGTSYAFWTVGMQKDALKPEQVAVEISGESSVAVARAPLGGLLYVTPKQAGRHALRLKNLSGTDLNVLVTARKKAAERK